MNHPLVDAVVDSLQRLDHRGGLVAAASGGPDSIALLAALDRAGVQPLIVAHINHKLRGAEGDSDAELVADLAQQFTLPFRASIADVATAASGRNVEAVARRLRYDALALIAKSENIPTVATAHTLSDQAETVLLRLLRGSGLAGLAGIRPRGRWNGVRILRPLLGVRREQVHDYLTATGLPYRVDSSNTDMRFARNRLRIELMPIIRSLGTANVDVRLARIAEESRRYAAVKRRRARHLIQKVELPQAGRVCVFHAEKLAELSADRLCDFLRYLWHRERWPTGDMSRDHWLRLAELCRAGPAAVDCPGGIRVRRLGRVVRAGPGA